MIRLITDKEEKERIIRLCDDAFDEGFFRQPDYEARLEKIDRFAEFYAAYAEGELAGYAALYNNDLASRKAFITSIGVRPSFRKRRIGSELMQKCIDRAKEKGMRCLRLEVRKDNKTAISFYRRHAFVTERECSPESDFMILAL